jgi:hypothetical protein
VTISLEPISLGYSCDVKYQLSRNLYFRWHPDHSETQFRNMLFRWLDQPTRFRRHIFDWMIAPFPAVCAYLENDFQGVFEREALELYDDGRKVRHRDLLTIHPHDFRPGPEGLYTEALIDQQYPAARAKFDYLAERFRRHLATPGPYLYVYKEIPTAGAAVRLRDLLSARSPDHLFQLLFVDYRGAVNQVLNELGGQAVKGWLTRSCDKAPDRRWEGDDASWDTIFNRFELGQHADGGSVHAGAAPWAVLPPPKQFDLSSPPAAAWRSLLDAPDAQAFLKVFGYVDAPRSEASLVRQEDRTQLLEPSPEAHFFCHFQPVAVLEDGAWVRVRLSWPQGVAADERVVASLQDQGCRNYRLAWDPASDGRQAWARVPWDVDDLRLVFTPAAGSRSFAPSAVAIDLYAPEIVPATDLKAVAADAAEYHVPTGPAARPSWRQRLRAVFGTA